MEIKTYRTTYDHLTKVLAETARRAEATESTGTRKELWGVFSYVLDLQANIRKGFMDDESSIQNAG